MAPATPSGIKIRLGIVSRAAFARECFKTTVSNEPDLIPIDLGPGEAASVDQARALDPDLVLVDLPPEQAVSFAEALLEAVPGTRPVAVHRSLEPEGLVRLAEAGFLGFASTDCTLSALLRELRAVARNESSGSPQLVGALLRSLKRQRGPAPAPTEHLSCLSARERQVAQLLEQRYSNKEIAAELGIEFGTVKNHVHNVLTKLHLHNRWELL